MKLWKVAPLDKAEARRIQTEYNLPAITAILMQIRHMTTGEEIEDFLYNESFIAPPDDIKDMDKAAARVRQAIESNERICVYGDYDADGVTSTALLYSYLEASGANVIYYIPSRETEGYGMNKNAVKTLSERGVKLIVTVDNGIAANEAVWVGGDRGGTLEVPCKGRRHLAQYVRRVLGVVKHPSLEHR